MIVINGIRYRPEDAKRLGIDTKPAAKKAPARNKARTVEKDARGGP